MIYFTYFAILQANLPELTSSLDDLGAFRFRSIRPSSINQVYDRIAYWSSNSKSRYRIAA